MGVDDFDTLYSNLEYINKMLSVRQRAKMRSFELRSGATTLKISRVPRANGDRYLIRATSKIGEVESNFNLLDIRRSNKNNSERLEKIIAYLKSNKSLFREPYPIHPKIYNVVVITE